MNKKILALGITLASLTLPQLVMAQSTTQSSSKNSGPLSFEPSDFPPNVLNYPSQIAQSWRASFNETKQNRMFMHTFKIKVPKGCKVTAGDLKVKVSPLGSTLPMNDSFGFVDDAQGIFSIKVWNQGDQAGASKTLSYNLASVPNVGSVLNTMNDGKFSIYLQDDTSVNSVSLKTTVSCPNDNPYGDPIDVKGEHFQCYDVKPEQKTKPVSIRIQDQFGRDEVVLGRPAMLCNPSAKTHGKKKYRIQNKERHLVCYTLAKQSPSKSQKVKINNQFEGNALNTGQRRLFCAPSLKKHL